MNEIFGADGADLAIGEKAGHRQGALRGLDEADVVVRLVKKIAAAAAAAHQEAGAGRLGRPHFLEMMRQVLRRGLGVAHLELQRLPDLQ